MLVTTDDDALFEKLLDYRVHGMRPKYFHHSSAVISASMPFRRRSFTSNFVISINGRRPGSAMQPFTRNFSPAPPWEMPSFCLPSYRDGGTSSISTSFVFRKARSVATQ